MALWAFYLHKLWITVWHMSCLKCLLVETTSTASELQMQLQPIQCWQTFLALPAFSLWITTKPHNRWDLKKQDETLTFIHKVATRNPFGFWGILRLPGLPGVWGLAGMAGMVRALAVWDTGTTAVRPWLWNDEVAERWDALRKSDVPETWESSRS